MFVILSRKYLYNAFPWILTKDSIRDSLTYKIETFCQLIHNMSVTNEATTKIMQTILHIYLFIQENGEVLLFTFYDK